MSKTFPKSLLLIGAGKMGGTLMRSWLSAGMPKKSITVVDTAASVKGALRSLDDVKIFPDCIVLAVKPQSLDELLPQVRIRFGDKPLYISIAAGKSINYFEEKLDGQPSVVRVMPNTPALIGKGISAACANKKVSSKDKKIVTTLFEAAGHMVWIKDEKHMDAVTALSGSGPAYLFLFLESIIAAGMQHGLTETVSRQLAIETIIGSAKLAKISKEPLARLRANVTSKGGTTEAALSILMKDNGLSFLIKEAVSAAVKRSRDLA